ncbi:MAG: hypothetical protein ACXVB0_14080 [Mucilaginibacter sp.]
MRKLLYLVLTLTALSCNSKNKSEPKTRADYLKLALTSDAYKNASGSIQMVHSMLDSVKKGKMDTAAVLFVYNNSIATATAQVKTVAEVASAMQKDTAYLKAVQLKAADDLELADGKK